MNYSIIYINIQAIFFNDENSQNMSIINGLFMLTLCKSYIKNNALGENI